MLPFQFVKELWCTFTVRRGDGSCSWQDGLVATGLGMCTLRLGRLGSRALCGSWSAGWSARFWMGCFAVNVTTRWAARESDGWAFREAAAVKKWTWPPVYKESSQKMDGSILSHFIQSTVLIDISTSELF